MRKGVPTAQLLILPILLSLLLRTYSSHATDLTTAPPLTSAPLNGRFLIMDVEGYAVLVDASTGAPLSKWTALSPPFGASSTSSGGSSLSNVSIMYPLSPDHEILLLQGDRSSGACCRFESLSFTLMKIATSSISSSVFLNDNRVLQLSGSLVPHSTSIGDVSLTIQQIQINATMNTSLVQTQISFIAATSSPVSPLPPSSVMALTEHSGGGRVSLVNDTDGSTAWMLPTSSRLHQAFYIDMDGDLHPVHIFSNWLVGQGMSTAAGGGGNNSSKLRIAEIASFDVFEHRSRLFCIVQQPQLLSVIQPPPFSSTVHAPPPPSSSSPFLGVASPPQLALAHTDSTMYSPFITNCVMRGDLSLDACLQGYHLVVGHSADPATWNSQRLLQAGSSDETGQDFVLPMLDSVVVQERDGIDYVVLKSKSTRVCDAVGDSSYTDEFGASGHCADDPEQSDKEWVLPASMPTAIKVSNWERRITISLTLPQALAILLVALVVAVVIWRLRKAKYQLLQAAAIAAALEQQKQQQQQQLYLQHAPVNSSSIAATGTAPPSSSPDIVPLPLSLPKFSRDPMVTSDAITSDPVKHSSASFKSSGIRNPQIMRVAHLNRAMSESDLMKPLRGAGFKLKGEDSSGGKGATAGLLSKKAESLLGAKGGVDGRFWNESSSSSDSDRTDELSGSEHLDNVAETFTDSRAIPRGGSDDEDSKKEIQFIQFGVAEADGRPEKSPAFSDASTLPRNSSASPAAGFGRRSSRRRLSETDKAAAAAACSPPHFTSFDSLFMPSALSSIEAELNDENPKRGGSKVLSRDGSGSSSGNTPHSTPKASPQVKCRTSRDTTISPLPLDLVAVGGGGKKRPDKLELPPFEHTPTNHYKTTFQEMMRVGQGGFGSVFKVRGLVDNRLYAVKKVKLPKNDAVLKKKMMRETVMMSTLSHMNIVRYHTAWEEHVLSSELEPPSNGNDSRSSWGLSASVSFTDNTERSDPDADLDNVVPVLFIQMEWCDISVKHWLEKRTAMCLSDVHSMFVQLLMGIRHMHDQGLIHRDIKPDNMFILPSGVLKIGDFGLSVSIRRRMEGVGCSWDGVTGSTPQTGSDAACFNGHLGASVSGDWSGTESSGLQRPDILNSSGEDLSSLNNTSRSQHDALTMSRDGNSRETSVLSVQQGDISFVAGTAAYAPPLSTGSFADDLYSVGIVLYELLHLFKTSMQRATALRDLRSSGTVPASFRAMFPLESDMIEELINPSTNKISTKAVFEKANAMFGEALPDAVKQDKAFLDGRIAGLQNELEAMKRQLKVAAASGGGESTSLRSPSKYRSPPLSPVKTSPPPPT